MPNNGKIEVADKFKHLPTQHNLTDSIRGGEFHSIVIKDKIWRLRSGGVLYDFIDNNGAPLKELDIVIAAIHPANSRTYYPGTFQSETSNPPTCASLNGVVPDPGVPIPQHKTCNGCPHDQWKPNRQGKDCKEHKRIAVVLLPWMKTRPALEKPLNKLVFFKVPTASMKIFKPYIDWLKSQGVPFQSVITRCTFFQEKWAIKFDYYKSLTDKDADLILPLTEPEASRHILGTMQEFKQIPPVAAPATTQETGFATVFGPQTETAAEPGAGHCDTETHCIGAGPHPPPAKRGPGRPRKVVEEVVAETKVADQPAEVLQLAREQSEESSFEEVEDDDDINKLLAHVTGKTAKPM